MGIKDLWNILQPYSERKPLFELHNKTVAVDLAGWVCEAMCVVNYEVQPRFYLRNLFFRTSYLLLTGVTPVFVLEGSAPPLKYGVICKRLEAGPLAGQRPRRIVRHAGVDGQTNNPKKAAQGRSSFNRILKHCEELLTSMGLTCVQGPGEAEAFCAYLNRAGMVDGVITQDSDCFAYGARRVYRNFSVASQGKTAAQGGMVEVYDMDKIERSMGECVRTESFFFSGITEVNCTQILVRTRWSPWRCCAAAITVPMVWPALGAMQRSSSSACTRSTKFSIACGRGAALPTASSRCGDTIECCAQRAAIMGPSTTRTAARYAAHR